jgi:O-antigen/teichoic acid export membrane protein
MGLGGFAVREVSRLRVRAEFGALRGFVSWAAAIVIAMAAIGGAVIAVLTAMPSLGLPTELVWSAAIAPLMGTLFLLRAVSQGFGRVFDAQAPTDLLRPAAMVLALGVAMVFAFPVTVDGVLILLVAANALSLSLAVIAVLRIFAKDVPAEPKLYSRSDWIRCATPFFGTTVLIMLHAELNTLLLGWLSSPVETGLFQPVLRFVPVMVIAVYAVNVPLAPRISELWEQGETERLKHVVGLATISVTMVTGATCAALLVLAPWILSAFGMAFTANVPALLWLAVAQVFGAGCGPVAILLNMTGHQRQATVSLSVAVVINFALGLWLIPQLGAYGAAIAMSASICAWNILMLREVIRTLGFDPSLVGSARRIGRLWIRDA